jgi:hypothetical protein
MEGYYQDIGRMCALNVTSVKPSSGEAMAITGGQRQLIVDALAYQASHFWNWRLRGTSRRVPGGSTEAFQG